VTFLKNIKISTKIFGGFGIVLLFLIVISMTGVVNLWNGNQSFKRYRSIALQTNQAGRVQANLLEARLAVKNFVISASNKNIQMVEWRTQKTLTLNAEFEKMVNSVQKKSVVEAANTDLNTYLKAFEKVTRYQARRRELVVKKLDVIGPQIERKLTKIMKSAYRDKDATAAFRAGTVQRNLLLMRLYATKYLVTNNDAAFLRVLKESSDMARNHKVMLGELENPVRRGLAEDVIKLHETYIKTVNEIHETIVQRNKVISGTLDTLGPKVAGNLEKLKLSIKKEQDSLGPTASAAMTTAVYITIAISCVSILLSVVGAWLIGTGISGPISSITDAMRALAHGNKTVEIPGRDHKDEIGDMASAVQVFKDNAIQQEIDEQSKTQERQVAADRRARMDRVTATFSSNAEGIVETVSSASAKLEETAESMAGISEQTSEQAMQASSASQQTSGNVQSVATATEEMTSTIGEISQQVSQASNASKQAVEEVGNTSRQMNALAETANKVGEVVEMISGIAEQTNLLALNATIESARAGEAGKGFAVVASEVKELASQTAKATDEISQQISDIQNATKQASGSMENVAEAISRVDEISTAIAAAMEEQSAATQEIAGSVNQAASGTQQVSDNIASVTQAAQEAGAASAHVKSAAGELSQQAEMLKDEVNRFISEVRAG
jgi:methyl-accepting chemotaxis protein